MGSETGSVKGQHVNRTHVIGRAVKPEGEGFQARETEVEQLGGMSRD